MHTVPGTLRVKVVEGALSSDACSAMDLAWNYDLVITSFQQLTLEERNRKAKQHYTSPLMQVRPLSSCFALLINDM
jgi:hypothetical protein